MVNRSLARIVALPVLLALAGCDAPQLDMKPGANSIFETFSGPTPSEAAAWAIDPYDPNNRYRGTLLLAGAPFAGEPVYMALFRDNSDDSDPGVRAAAVRAIAIHGQPEDAAILVERLKDSDIPVRVESARGLQRLYFPTAIDGLIETLDAEKEPEYEVRLEAALALGQYAENRVVEQLITALADPNLAVNRNTLWSLRALTGQDFGYNQKAWLLWYKGAGDAFAARGGYMYPAFNRDRSWWEYLPFVSPPPNEPTSVPVGMPTER
ncbi:MAG: HEAT repeat domain-containing protein [Phycisphaerales bacterium]